jgi:hypothetical protein
MRRVLLVCALIPLAALLRPSPGFAVAGTASAASVKLVDCVPALDPQDRTATFEARVRPTLGTDRMQVRFTLQVREGALAAWHRVVAAGLDQWLTSAPGVSRYSYSKTVRNLSAPAAYRTLVRFRWLDADGAVQARSRATSRTCRQPDLRPDLAATRIDFVPAVDGDPARYAVTLENRGRTAAGPFSIALNAGGVQLEPLALPGLAADEQRVLTFTGRPCTAGEPLTVTVDGDDAVDERDEDDNVLVATCPP